MAVTQYIGARYVPIPANPIEWSSSNNYEPLTIVTYQGNSYTSRQYVPAGIDITNNNFWALTGNYNAQIEQYREEVNTFNGRITANTNAIAAEVTARENAIAAEVTARENADINLTELVNDNASDIAAEITARENADINLTRLVNDNASAIAAEITAREDLANLIIKNVKDYGATGDGVTNDTPAINAAIADGGIVYFPEGTYRLFTSITPVSNLWMIGYKAKLYVDRTSYEETTQYSGIGFVSNSSSQKLENVVIEGFEITGNTNFASNGITIRQANTIASTVIRRIFIKNCHIHDMGFRGVNVGGSVSGDGPFGHGTPDVTVEGCEINDCGGHTICNSGTSMRVLNSIVRNSGSECISVDNGCYKFWIDNCYVENATGGAGCISVDECNSVFISNTFISQPNHDRPVLRFNNASGDVNNAFVNNCFFYGGSYSLSMGATNYHTQLFLSSCEGSGPTTGSVLSRNSEDMIMSAGNNWFRTMTTEEKAALASKIKNSTTATTII